MRSEDKHFVKTALKDDRAKTEKQDSESIDKLEAAGYSVFVILGVRDER